MLRSTYSSLGLNLHSMTHRMTSRTGIKSTTGKLSPVHLARIQDDRKRLLLSISSTARFMGIQARNGDDNGQSTVTRLMAPSLRLLDDVMEWGTMTSAFVPGAVARVMKAHLCEREEIALVGECVVKLRGDLDTTEYTEVKGALRELKKNNGGARGGGGRWDREGKQECVSRLHVFKTVCYLLQHGGKKVSVSEVQKTFVEQHEQEREERVRNKRAWGREREEGRGRVRLSIVM